MTPSGLNFFDYAVGSPLTMRLLEGEKCYPGTQSRAWVKWYHLEKSEDILKRHCAPPFCYQTIKTMAPRD